ncbi:MAG: TMEM43 family protein [Bacteroidaceae bacterium]|nr:TMEM43 family protein [Bacteroidaceae bacterium]
MAYQEVKTTGYGTRVGRSFKGIGTGFLLFFGATALLWWNEGRAVKTDKMLDEAENAYVEMENPNKKDATLDGELVCATAVATTEDSLIDQQYGIGAKAISLQRKVEYYQWVEHSESNSEDKLGGKEVTTTTYTYSKEWVSEPVNSSEFKDEAYRSKNFVLTTVEDADLWAENVTFGAYRLNESLIHSISSRESMDLAISDNTLEQINNSAKVAYERFYGVKKTVEQPAQTVAVPDSVKASEDSIHAAMASADNKKDFEYVHQAGNVLYYGRVPGSPEVGDIRVTFEKIVPAKVTIISEVDGDTFKPYKAGNGKRFQTLVMGKKDAGDIFESEHDANSMWLWIIRVIGVMLVIGGLRGILGFIEAILKVVPFIAGIFGWGVGVVCTVIGIVWSLIVIALAWLFYRPLLGITLLAVACFFVWVFAFKGKDKLKELAAKAKANNE